MPNSQKTQRYIILSALFLLFILILLSAFQKQHWDSDIFWALRSGEWIIENWKVPKVDYFSYTFQGHEWIDFTWGFQVIAYLFFTYLGGWFGLFVLQVLVVGTTFYLLWKNLSALLQRNLLLALLLTLIVYAGAHDRFFIRPHLFAYFFMTLYLYLLTLYEKRDKRRYLIYLIPIQFLWTNIHSSFILGYFIIGAYAFGRFIDDWREKGISSDISPGLKLYIFTGLAVLVASLINPYGYKLIIFPFIHMGGENKDAVRHIMEWMPTSIKSLLNFYPIDLSNIAFRALLIWAVVLLVRDFKRFRIRESLLFILFGYMAIKHGRWTVNFQYAIVPVVAMLTASSGTGGIRQQPEKMRLITGGACVAIFFLLFLDAAYFTNYRIYGLGLKKGHFPESTVRFIKENKLTGNMYNLYDFGGYIIYHLYPDVRVFLDGRTPTVYSPYFFFKSRMTNANEIYRHKLEEEYGIDMELIARSKRCKKLMKDDKWKMIAFDDASVLFLKDTLANRAILEEWEYKYLDPCSSILENEDKKELLEIRRELKRAIQVDSTVQWSHRWLGVVDTALGGEYLQEAIEELRKALDIVEGKITWYNYGLALRKAERYEEAIQALNKSLKFGYAKAEYTIGITYYDLKDYFNTIKYLERYVGKFADASDPQAYDALAFSYYHSTDRMDKAINYFKRAAFTAKEAARSAELYYHLGNTLFEVDEYDEAKIYYKKAVELDKKYIKVLSDLADKYQEAGRDKMARELMEFMTSLQKAYSLKETIQNNE